MRPTMAEFLDMFFLCYFAICYFGQPHRWPQTCQEFSFYAQVGNQYIGIFGLNQGDQHPS